MVTTLSRKRSGLDMINMTIGVTQVSSTELFERVTSSELG